MQTRITPPRRDDVHSYEVWRDRKLAGHPATAGDLVVEVADPAALTAAEVAALADRLARCNMAVYAAPAHPALSREGLRAFGRRFGLERLDANMLSDADGITPLAVAGDGTRTRYIPYTNRPLAWHTDGYYNTADDQVRAILLHCVRPAAEGGANALLDHEIAYILLREADPAHVEALSRPDAMTIPANAEEGQPPRPDSVGPVFSLGVDGRLHMRYTRRKTNIVWSPDPAVRAAVAALEAILDSDTPYILRHRLEAGQGLICANVLHNRARFEDSSEAGGAEGRLLYRARYHDPIRLP
ncbi:TauD/TfdA family dioxygenase [Novispirillum sp. DQ9]|uniref:TauD/TfdA family dioxygenase n=1 Tax=Novispirillum sp. DQ9 TaxID=3398612 RepID=UPI003C7BA5BB